MVPHTLDDVKDFHLEPRVASDTPESTEKPMFFRTKRVVVSRRLDCADEIADRDFQGARDLQKPLQRYLSSAELEVRERSLRNTDLAR